MENEQNENGNDGAAEVDNETSAYFAEHGDLVNDDGTPVDAPEGGESTPEENSAPVEGEAPKKGEIKPEEKKTGSVENSFFEMNEKGEKVFKADAAFDFLFPEKPSENSFKYEPIKMLEEVALEPSKQKEAELSPRRKAYAEEKAHREEVRQSLFAFNDILKEAIQAGNTPEQAIKLAESRVQKAYEDYINDRQIDFEERLEKELNAPEITKAQRESIRAKAASNEAAYYAEFGGQEGLNELLFGKMEDGKHSPGVGTDMVWMLFKLQNPEIAQKGATQKQLAEKMSDWWADFASNPEQLSFLMEMVVGRRSLMGRMMPHLKDKITQTAQSRKSAVAESRMRNTRGLRPSARTPQGEAQNATLDAWFNPSAPRGVAVV